MTDTPASLRTLPMALGPSPRIRSTSPPLPSGMWVGGISTVVNRAYEPHRDQVVLPKPRRSGARERRRDQYADRCDDADESGPYVRLFQCRKANPLGPSKA